MLRLNKDYLKLVKDIVQTSDLQDGGYLLPKQANAFIKMAMDTVELLKAVRTVTMPTPTYEIDKIGVGQRLMRGYASENEDFSAYTQNPIFGKLELVAKKYGLPWEISEDALEENIEKMGLEATIAKLMAEQMGLDTEDLGVNGDYVTPSPSDALNGGINDVVTTITVNDTTGFPDTSEAGFLVIETEHIDYTGKTATTFTGCTRGANGTVAAAHVDATAVTWFRDVLIGVDDGWLKIIENGDANQSAGNLVDGSSIASGHLDKAHFFAMLQAMPKKYKRGNAKKLMRWVCSTLTKEKWLEYLTDRATGAGDRAMLGETLNPLGIPFMEVASFPDDKLLLTVPKNLIVGVWRKIKLRKAINDRIAVATDTRFYHATVKMDYQVEETDATVLMDGYDFAWT